MMITIWGAAIVVFLILEAITVGITCIWFALGSICALIAALLGAPMWLQITWFAIVSIGTLILTRPLVKKFINSKVEPTNADRVIGIKASVREGIDNLAGTGSVFCDGKEWSARSEDGSSIAAGSVVTVKAIEGVKLIVSAE